MVKIRLKRQGNKHRPFYRVVVAHSSAGRDGSFIEIIGTYNPLDKENGTVIKGDRAMHWLLVGAQPTETVGYLLKKAGVLEEFLAQRPAARRNYAYLNKAIAPVTQATAVDSSPAPAASEEASASE